ncbi:bifunctional (p)ppGpp synthetase/guanosine-3',5'-bis(diphosphate) 3'-pyrophosphohydrolase [Porphyromonas sp.]|uniref:RelA/SpoT family protein n=1 Tax=Porphyromonas sp. TaxID=1924944 RepID=UPI0026DB2222|nr:TGS domain-containing protein [Porphyromonas sp.]MDO4771727.1 TGS domain-containing protein [Porphyromonas sp.]
MKIKNKIDLSSWRELLRELYRLDHGVSDEQRRRLIRIMHKAVRDDVFDEDRHGIHGLIRTLLSAIASVEEIGLKQSAVIVILIYRAVLKEKYSVVEAKADFGEDVADLLSSLLRLSELYSRNTVVTSENFSHFLLSFAVDVRVILILIADRLMLMRLANLYFPEKEQRTLAMEVSFLYAPLAHRMGLYSIKSEMEDLVLKYTDRTTYDFIKRKLNETKSSRDAYIDAFISPLKKRLSEEGLRFDIKGRTKSISSIRSKLKKQNIEFESIYDLFAIRIVIDAPLPRERNQCWQAYSVVTDMYRPNPNRLKDWISIPKSNGYESLHITVMGPENKWVEVQIRTRRMDEVAEKGLAAHWRYKGIKPDEGIDDFLTSVRRVLESKESNTEEVIKDFKMDLYEKEIYVFTPKGDLIKLPHGATVLDFAFAIHSNIGSKCVSGKVNERNVSIRHPLQNGDSVSIVTSNTQSPKADWLQFVITSKARVKIKQLLREQSAKALKDAKEEVQRRIKNRKMEYDDATFIKLIKKKGFKIITDFFLAITENKLDINTFLDDYKVALEERTARSTEHSEKERADAFVMNTPAVETTEKYQDVLLIDKNLSGIEYKLAKCCNPIFGDEVFAFTSKAGIRIHRMDCPNAPDLFERYGYRILQAKWTGQSKGGYEVRLRIVGNDDLSIVSNITGQITKENAVHLRSFNIDSTDGLFNSYFTVHVQDISVLKALIKRLRGVKGVKQVERIDSV